MSKILTVAAREFIETVKTKTFIITTVLMPLLIIAFVFATEKIGEMAKDEQMPPKLVVVVDESGRVHTHLAAQVAVYNEASPMQPMQLEPAPAAALDAEVRERIEGGEVYAYVLIPADVVETDAPVELGRSDSNLQWGRRIEELVEQAVIDARFASADPPIDYAYVKQLERPVGFRQVDTRSGQETTGNEIAQFMTPFAFMFLLFMGTMNISQGLLTSLIEEKSSRVVEVLLSAVSPLQLMAGKILGMVAVGALLMGVWGVLGYSAARHQEMDYLVTPFRLTHMVLYFVPGFLFFAAMLAAIGSVCNTIKDAQSLATPVTLLTIVPMMLWWYISENPNSAFAIALSYIPPITPFVMILRICADPDVPMLQIVTTQAVLWFAVVATVWAASKVFRVGVLMYGKPPSLREMARWVRYA